MTISTLNVVSCNLQIKFKHIIYIFCSMARENILDYPSGGAVRDLAEAVCVAAQHRHAADSAAAVAAAAAPPPAAAAAGVAADCRRLRRRRREQAAGRHAGPALLLFRRRSSISPTRIRKISKFLVFSVGTYIFHF